MLIQVHTSTASREQARLIAHELVAGGLCACAHIDEIESFYRWQGELENHQEFRVALQCRAELLPRVAEVIRSRHSYQLPAIYALPVCDGSAEYLAWLREHSGGQ